MAVLGANGFIGSHVLSRLIESRRPVRALVRSAARVEQLGDTCEARVVDAASAVSLFRGLEGCTALVHAVVGDPNLIVESVAAAFDAAAAAGVRRIVYLSSASVHGPAPTFGTTELTPLSIRQAFYYSIAKVRAEQRIALHRARSKVEVVVLRPQIVYGRGAYWVNVVAQHMLDGAAYWVDEGRGVCDAVAVENVAHAVELALDASGVDGCAFFVGDAEQVTWRDFFAPIAAALNVDLATVAHVEPAELPRWSARQRIVDAIRRSATLHELADRGPVLLRRPLDKLFGRQRGTLAAASVPAPIGFEKTSVVRAALPDPAFTELQRCRYKLPLDRARALLGYEPVITFAEGMRRTCEALRSEAT